VYVDHCSYEGGRDLFVSANREQRPEGQMANYDFSEPFWLDSSESTLEPASESDLEFDCQEGLHHLLAAFVSALIVSTFCQTKKGPSRNQSHQPTNSYPSFEKFFCSVDVYDFLFAEMVPMR